MKSSPGNQILESVYDHPTLYDVLFSESCRKETAFLCQVLDQYVGRTTGSVFEPACGTGRLLWRLGKLGNDIVGLDLNTKAVDYCNRRLRRHGLSEAAVLGDMVDVSLRSLKRKKPFDLAYNLVSSFLHLTTEEDALRHLEAISGLLKPNGLYVLGLHLHPLGEAFCSQESWVVRHGALTVHSKLHRKDLDRRRRLETVEFRIRGTTPRRSYEVIDTFPLRTYTAAQFLSLLKKVAAFETVETFDFDLDLQQPIRIGPGTEDVVFLLRKIR